MYVGHPLPLSVYHSHFTLSMLLQATSPDYPKTSQLLYKIVFTFQFTYDFSIKYLIRHKKIQSTQ